MCLKIGAQIDIMQVEHKLSIKTVYFLGVRGLTASSYIVYAYTTGGNTDLWSIYVLYIQYPHPQMCMYIYIYIYNKTRSVIRTEGTLSSFF